jgi:5S rRNA maturation endonuclease (ribonuclease M5)
MLTYRKLSSLAIIVYSDLDYAGCHKRSYIIEKLKAEYHYIVDDVC